MRMFLLLLMPLALVACDAKDYCEPDSLNILLTNDDGFDQPGITALHRSLKAAGHHVKRIAPYRNYSGSSASLTYDTLTAPNRPNAEFSEIYEIGGSPATTVVLGVTAIFGADIPVDLVVSGINNGLNLGPALTASGTVGAVVTGMRLVQPSVPGIAISTGRLGDGVTPEQNETHLANVAGFVTRLVGASQCGEDGMLKSGQSLNVNYPRLDPTEIKGVRMLRQGGASYLRFWFSKTTDDQYEFQYERIEPSEDISDSDVLLTYAGFITIVPIDGDYSAEPAFDAGQLLKVEP
jgi:5'-nucleotidase